MLRGSGRNVTIRVSYTGENWTIRGAQFNKLTFKFQLSTSPSLVSRLNIVQNTYQIEYIY
jgi:hypothetical protein